MNTVLNAANSIGFNLKFEFLKQVKNILHVFVMTILYILLIVLFVGSILFVTYFVDSVNNLKNGSNKIPLFGTYVIVSQSMVPTININDGVFVMRTSSSSLRPGDIVTFSSKDSRYSGLTITHRIVSMESSDGQNIIYTTKGDNNKANDLTPINEQDIYGKVLFKIPKLGLLQSLYSRYFFLLVLLLIPCVVFILYGYINQLKYKFNNKKKTVTSNKNYNIEVLDYNDYYNDIELLSYDSIEIL